MLQVLGDEWINKIQTWEWRRQAPGATFKNSMLFGKNLLLIRLEIWKEYSSLGRWASLSRTNFPVRHSSFLLISYRLVWLLMCVKRGFLQSVWQYCLMIKGNSHVFCRKSREMGLTFPSLSEENERPLQYQHTSHFILGLNWAPWKSLCPFCSLSI